MLERGLAELKIVCIGSFNCDMVYGVDHIAVGGETVLSSSLNKYWGGKGLNQAVALARSYDNVYMAGMVNHKDDGLRDYLHKNNLHDDYLVFSDQPTGHAIIYVDKNGQNSITVFGGANQALTEEFVSNTLSGFEAGDIVLIQNETNALDIIIREAHSRGLLIAMNPSPFASKLLELPLEYVSFFILNEIEGNQITGKTQHEEILQAMQQRYPNAATLLTLGKHGVVYAVGKNRYRHGIYDVPVVDTTAAGDTFTGYFLSGYARGLAPERILEQASKASSIAVSRAGATVSIPDLNEVQSFTGKQIN